jgi:RimJ/RimL family protein N-acetyltransferase
LTPPQRLVSQRLILRRWRESDIAPFARLNADPQVMRFFARRYGLEETRQRVSIWSDDMTSRGYAPWAVEAPGVASFIGVVGPSLITAEIALAGQIEILWRLDRPSWGQGYAVEAAHAALHDVFERLECPEVVAYTTAVNLPSRKVMQKLGMIEDEASAFAHPAVAEGNPLRPHVVSRLTRQAFLRSLSP